jgi:hypothetical protein
MINYVSLSNSKICSGIVIRIPFRGRFPQPIPLIMYLNVLTKGRSSKTIPARMKIIRFPYLSFCAFSILAQVSYNDTVRLKTSFSSDESGSTQK